MQFLKKTNGGVSKRLIKYYILVSVIICWRSLSKSAKYFVLHKNIKKTETKAMNMDKRNF